MPRVEPGTVLVPAVGFEATALAAHGYPPIRRRWDRGGSVAGEVAGCHGAGGADTARAGLGRETEEWQVGRTVRTLLWLAGLAYLATWLANRSLVEVRGASMEPVLRAGDRLLTVPARPGSVRPGRVVVVVDPADPTHLVVKRVAAAIDGRVTVLGDHAAASTDSRTWGPLPLGEARRVVVRRWPDLRTRLHRPA